MPLTEKGKEIMGNMKKEYGAEKAKEVFYASKNKGTIAGVDSAGGGKLGNFSKEQARVFGNSPVSPRADATPPLKQRGPAGETWKGSPGPIDAHLDSMRRGFKK